MNESRSSKRSRRQLPVVVLCGGAGTRLRNSVTGPKVLAPVGGRPYLSFLLRWLIREGLRDIVLATGYLGDEVERFVDAAQPGLEDYAKELGEGSDREDEAVSVRCVREASPLGTAGAIANAVRELQLTGSLFALNGDTLFTGSPARLVDACPPDAPGAIAVVEVEDASRFGSVDFDLDSGRIRQFVEKSEAAGRSGWINAGLYLLRADRFESVSEGKIVSLERALFPRWAAEGLIAVPFIDAHFLDIGTPADYRRAVDFFEEAGWNSHR